MTQDELATVLAKEAAQVAWDDWQDSIEATRLAEEAYWRAWRDLLKAEKKEEKE